MFYRLKQVLNHVFPNIREEDLEFANTYLKDKERKYFEKMSAYDKRHSINVLKNVLESELLRNDTQYYRLALLHDCGKPSRTTFFQRVYYVFTKKGPLQFHAKRGFEMLKNHDYKLALLVLKHHNKNIQNDKLIEFQKIDDKN